MQEIWKVIDEFPNYEVSNMGYVRSIVHYDKWGREKGGHILKPCFDGKGNYLHVTLYKDGKQLSKNIHRLVAMAFIANPFNYKEINHIDEDKTNNAASNLEWCTHQYNNSYGTKSVSGAKNPMNKFSYEVIVFIKKNHKFCGGSMGTKELADKFNMSQSHVSSIAHGRRWVGANSV